MTFPALIAWSSGKDSAMALHEVRRAGDLDVVAAVTTVVAPQARVSMHGVPPRLLEAQAAALDLPLVQVEVPSFPCPNDVYERAMGAVFDRFKAQGVKQVVYGDLFLEDIRTYRLSQLERRGVTGVFPLWRRDTRQLAAQMIDCGIEATLVVVDRERLDPSFLGRRFDHQLLRDLPRGVDPCGENGEYHTFVSNGPGFRQAIRFEQGEVSRTDGFLTLDLDLS